MEAQKEREGEKKKKEEEGRTGNYGEKWEHFEDFAFRHATNGASPRGTNGGACLLGQPWSGIVPTKSILADQSTPLCVAEDLSTTSIA